MKHEKQIYLRFYLSFHDNINYLLFDFNENWFLNMSSIQCLLLKYYYIFNIIINIIYHTIHYYSMYSFIIYSESYFRYKFLIEK